LHFVYTALSIAVPKTQEQDPTFDIRQCEPPIMAVVTLRNDTKRREPKMPVPEYKDERLSAIAPQPQPWFEFALRYLDEEQQRIIIARILDM
jgi:hypothetical protein